jgi:hypothetical protein
MTEQTKLQHIKPGTPEMEALLQAGYPDMSVAKAQQIIKERKDNPALWPYEVMERAEAFLAAYNAKPIAVSTKVPERKLHKNDE